MSPSRDRPSRGPSPAHVLQFQDTMRRFMEIEGRVIRAYLDRTRVQLSPEAPSGGQRSPRPPAVPPAPPLTSAAWPLLEADDIREAGGGYETVHALRPEHDRLLDNHRLEGHPVLPAAEAMEMMAELAKRVWPQLEMAEMRDVRVLRGVVVSELGQQVRITATPTAQGRSPDDGVVLRASVTDVGDERTPYYSATLVLRRRLPQPPLYREQYRNVPDPFPATVAEAYDTYMVHGPEIRCIRRIDGVGEEGVIATLTPSSASRLLAWQPRGSWVLDPVAVDTAFQLGWMWARIIHRALPYPYYFGTCRRYRPMDATELRCFLHLVADQRTYLMRSRLYFVETGGMVVASFEGIESALKPLQEGPRGDLRQDAGQGRT